jgi:hypothetical protein
MTDTNNFTMLSLPDCIIPARPSLGGPLDDPPDSLVPDAVVQEEFGVGPMGLHRWDADAEMAALGWPPPVYIRKRKYRSRKKLETFKAAPVRRSIRDRSTVARGA